LFLTHTSAKYSVPHTTPAAATAAGDGYTWSQTEDELELVIKAPAGTKGKDVKSKFTASMCSVKVGAEVNVEVNLFGKVTPDGCTWQMSDGNVVVTLEKAVEGESWPALVR
jgi:hypothetical protein